MCERSSFLKTLIVSGALAVTGAAASAEQLEVYVYEQGYLPNLMYLGDATEVTFVNKDAVTITLNYADTAETEALAPSIPAGGTYTVARAMIEGRSLQSPWVDGVGHIGTEGTFTATAGDPPLQ